MTDGERLVWAAAFVNRLSDMNNPMLMHLITSKGEKDQIKALQQLALLSVEFADLAVGAMKVAQEEYPKEKELDNNEYKRLLEMLYAKGK